MPQNIAAKKAWIKIYRRKGQHAKADKLEQELEKHEKSRMLSRPQAVNEFVKRVYRDRVPVYDLKNATYVYAKRDDPAIEVQRDTLAKTDVGVLKPGRKKALDRIRRENRQIESQIERSLK